jgi:hypothetical protein
MYGKMCDRLLLALDAECRDFISPCLPKSMLSVKFSEVRGEKPAVKVFQLTVKKSSQDMPFTYREKVYIRR